jgi:hypothetical protein
MVGFIVAQLPHTFKGDDLVFIDLDFDVLRYARMFQNELRIRSPWEFPYFNGTGTHVVPSSKKGSHLAIASRRIIEA